MHRLAPPALDEGLVPEHERGAELGLETLLSLAAVGGEEETRRWILSQPRCHGTPEGLVARGQILLAVGALECVAAPDVDAYDALSGKLLWSQTCLGSEVAPSPAYANGVVYSANEYANAGAIRIGGTADAVESEIIWESDDLLPEISSPVGDGERFYFGTSAGEFVCLDAATGEELWVEEPGDAFDGMEGAEDGVLLA